ncbi:MAG: efflux RND transporter periplasmic adaptor subunit [Oscillospiraceae bacterium]|nr:efflux RND transporter periplasmic adaptor subunit [Oscillospiraceae bacterium]
MKKTILILSMIFTLLMTSCFFFPEEEPLLDPPVIKQDEVTYVTYTARRGEIISRVVTTGYVTSKTFADCFFTDYTGNLKAIYVFPGDFVQEGQLIAELDVGELEFDLETARLTAELMRLTYNTSGTQEARLNMELAQNTYEQLQARMDGSRIYAPMTGQVAFVERLSPGEEINPHRVLVRIIDPDDLRITAEATDTISYTHGDIVDILVNSVTYAGVITRTPQVARAEGADDVNALWADFTADVPGFAEMGKHADIILIRGRSENAVIIPKNLVKTLGDRTYVQIYDNGVKVDVDVVTGISNATEIEIISGLEEGQQVVVK